MYFVNLRRLYPQKKKRFPARKSSVYRWIFPEINHLFWFSSHLWKPPNIQSQSLFEPRFSPRHENPIRSPFSTIQHSPSSHGSMGSNNNSWTHGTFLGKTPSIHHPGNTFRCSIFLSVCHVQLYTCVDVSFTVVPFLSTQSIDLLLKLMFIMFIPGHISIIS